MHIIHIASELSPVAKVGGLGDVIHGLAKEQAKAGNTVEIILPKYDVLKYNLIEDFQLTRTDLWSFEDAYEYHNAVWSGIVDGLKVYFIEPHHNQYYFNRGMIYGALNDIERFLYFSRTALEFLHTEKKHPDILHLHDWPTAAVAPLTKELYKDLGFSPKGIVLTLHNMEHQGKCTPKHLTSVGLRGEDYRTEELLQDQSAPSLLNLLKGGIIYSDALVTVSPKYAEEIHTPEFGYGLEKTIQTHTKKLSGILNGIEIETWNPTKDPYLFSNYPPNGTFIDKVQKGKEENKKELFKKLGIKPTKGPLLTSVTRIARQKGPKLIQDAIHYTMEHGGNFILLGSTQDKEMEEEFIQLKKLYKSHENLFIHLRFDEELAHQIYGAADAIVIPSLFEPCGLTQMISMRYGTIPIARKTGGLANTIFDLNDSFIPENQKTGFLFIDSSKESLYETLDRAFSCYTETPSKWEELIKNGLNTNLCWKTSASAYQKLYLKVVSKDSRDTSQSRYALHF